MFEGRPSLKKPLLVTALSLLIGSLPVLSVMVSSAVASRTGCTLHEGFSNPCFIGSFDAGSLLYAMFVSGWVALVTVPAGLIGVAVGVVLTAIALVQRRITDKG